MMPDRSSRVNMSNIKMQEERKFLLEYIELENKDYHINL